MNTTLTIKSVHAMVLLTRGFCKPLVNEPVLAWLPEGKLYDGETKIQPLRTVNKDGVRFSIFSFEDWKQATRFEIPSNSNTPEEPSMSMVRADRNAAYDITVSLPRARRLWEDTPNWLQCLKLYICE